jgi:hypothetical protein
VAGWTPATRVLRWSLGRGIDIAIAHSARMKVCQAFAYAKTLNRRRFGLVHEVAIVS